MSARKCMNDDMECSEEGSNQTEQVDTESMFKDETAWYLQGPKTIYINYYAISEADYSSESEVEDDNQDDESDTSEEDSDDEEEDQATQPQTEIPAEDMPEGASELTVVEDSSQVTAEGDQEQVVAEKKDEPSDVDSGDIAPQDSDIHKGEGTTQGDYWQIRKLMKYIRSGDEATTTVALSMVGEHDLTLEGHKNAIIDTGGLELFLNILNVEHLKCLQGALKVLKQLVIMPDVGSDLVELGIMEDLIGLLKHSEEDILLDVVCILADLAESQLKVRTISRKIDMLPYLIDIVDKIPRNVLVSSINSLSGSPMIKMEIASDTMRTLAALSRSRGVRMVLYKCGILHLLPTLLLSKENDIKNNALLIIMYCASIPVYRSSFEAHEILKLVTSCWKDSTKDEIFLRIIFKMTDSDQGRKQAIKCKVLKKIITLMRDEKIFNKYNVLKYCLASLYRLGQDDKVKSYLQDLDLIDFLVRNLACDDEGLLVYVSGVLSYLSPYSKNWKKMKDAGCVSVLMGIIEGKMNTALLANVDQVVGDLANDRNLLNEFSTKDAIRHIWSHLGFDSCDLQIAASQALVNLLNIDDSGEELRNLSGSIDLLVDLLDSKNDAVKASACQALAKVTCDQENLNIFIEMNLVKKINNLITTSNPLLKHSLCQLIAGVVEHPKGCYEIGRSDTIEHLVNYLVQKFKTLDASAQSSAARALWKLSVDPINAANLYNAGVVPLLIDCLGEGDSRVLEPVEGCLFNIRSLAQEAEAISFYGDLKPGASFLRGQPRPVEYVPKYFKEPTMENGYKNLGF